MKPLSFLLLLLAACAEVPDLLVVHAPAQVELHVGETARLDATCATSPSPLSYRWTLEEKPAASAPLMIGRTASRLHFTPGVAGDYLVSITVTDGRRTSPPAVTRLIVRPAPELAGTLKVRVLDASNGQPLPGALASVAGLKATTDHQGLAVLKSPKLVAPVTLHVSASITRRHDHDADPTTAAVDWPWYRGATVVDVRTAEVSIALHPSVETLVPVGGSVDPSLFALIPEVAPALSLGTGHASGQARVVMIAPVPTQPLEALQPQHLFTQRARSLVPANLATDDASLHALAPFLGVDTELTRFETRSAPGRQTFFVLGGVVTFQLDGVKWQPRAERDIHRLGRFETALSFAALVTLDVPPGGLELSQALRPELFDELWQLDTQVEALTQTATDPLTGEALELERVKLDGARQARASAPARVPDQRLEAWQDRHLIVSDGLDGRHRLRVPEQTGPSDTDLPFHLLVAAATTPQGVLPLGFALVRDMDRTLEETTFRLPEATGSLRGARFEVLATARRGFLAETDGAPIVPGDSRQIRELLDDRVLDFAPAKLAHEPTNRWNGLMSLLMAERADPTRLPFDLVRVVPLFIHSGLEGDPGRELLVETDGAARVHSALSRRYNRREGETLHSDLAGLWDTYQPAGATTPLPLPELTALPYVDEHTQLQLEVTTTSSDRRQAHDVFLIRLP